MSAAATGIQDDRNEPSAATVLQIERKEHSGQNKAKEEEKVPPAAHMHHQQEIDVEKMSNETVIDLLFKTPSSKPLPLQVDGQWTMLIQLHPISSLWYQVLHPKSDSAAEIPDIDAGNEKRC